MAKQDKSAVNEVSEYGKQQIAKFNKIAGAVNKVAAEPRFRKAISVLNHRTPFIEATIQLPAFQKGDGLDSPIFNWDMFELPYNNIESLELKTEGGAMNVELKFSDTSFVFARNLILKLQAIASSGDFSGTPIIRLRWGWSESGLNKTPKNTSQPIIQNVLFFQVDKITADTDLTKENYTLSGMSLESPQGLHAGLWKPFNYFGPQPLLDFAWNNFYETLTELKKKLETTGEAELTAYDKKLKEAVNNKKENDLLNGKKNQALSSFVINLKKVYGVENLESIRRILSGVNAVNSINITSTNKVIDNSGVNTADFKILSDANKSKDEKDLFNKVNKSSPKKMIDVISKGIENRDIKGMVDQLFPIIGELHVNAYDALCHCIAGMLEQNSQINKISSKGKNKILFLNFIPTSIIEDIKNDKTKKDPTKDKVKVSSISCNKYYSWQKLLSDIASHITIAPGATEKTKVAPKNSEAQNSKSLSFLFKSYNKNLQKTDIEKVSQIISLIYETSTVVSNSPADVSSLGKKITKEINDVIADPLYENITFIMISEKNLDTLFNNTAWGNRVFQSYSSKPLKKKGEFIFNSGTIKMSDEGFPDVISFKPEMDFNSVRSSLISSAESSRSTREGSMTVKDKNDAPPKKESGANVIVADTRIQSVNINELRDITIPLNTTDSMVGDAFIDFKRKETNMRKLFASKMNSAMTGELVIFGEPAWDELSIQGFPFLFFKHYTNNGSMSEYSGLWRVMAANHSISGGKFTTSLKLRKEFVDDIDPFNNESIMSGNISVNPVNNEQKNS